MHRPAAAYIQASSRCSKECTMPVIETIVAIVFVYALLSLIASSFKELLENFVQKRKQDMRGAILDLLGEAGGRRLFASGTITAISNSPSNTADPDKARDWPSYIEDKTFARVVSELVKDGAFQSSWQDSPLGRAVAPLAGQGEALVDAIEAVYRERMERVQGSFKRNAQVWLFGIGFVLAVALDADTLHLIKRIRSDAALRATVVSIAAAQATPDAVARLCPPGGDDGKSAPASQQSLNSISSCIDGALPDVLGWSEQRWSEVGSLSRSFLLALCGYLVTAAAISLGAPFWFDLLGKVSNLRATMKSKP
jgi:hypothetical protein